MNNALNKELYSKTKENISNNNLLFNARRNSKNFTGIISNSGNLNNIKRSRKFILPSSQYGMRYRESSSALWDLYDREMDLFITDKYGLLKNEIDADDSLERINKARLESEKVIYFFGGSTMMSLGSRIPFFSITSLIEKLLKIKTGKNFTCINFAVGGTCCQEALNLLINRALKIAKPNMVVFYDGWNCATYLALRSKLLHISEKFNLNLPITAGETIRQFEHNITLDKVFNYKYCLSRLLKMSIGEVAGLLSPRESKVEKFIGRIQEKFLSLRTNSELSKIANLIKDDEINDKSIEESVSDYISIHQFAKAITNSLDIQFVTFLQPLTCWGSKKLTKKELDWYQSSYKSERSKLHKLFKSQLLAQITNKSICENFIDLTNVFDDFEDELYIDTGHINRLGNLIVSEKITKEILAIL